MGCCWISDRSGDQDRMTSETSRHFPSGMELDLQNQWGRVESLAVDMDFVASFDGFGGDNKFEREQDRLRLVDAASSPLSPHHG